MHTDSAIEVKNVSKSYRGLSALKKVSFKVRRGSIFGLLGPNGAGKTTLVKIMTTLTRPDSGTILIDGVDVVQSPSTVRAKIGLAGQYAAVDENLTGFENITLVGRLYHLSKSHSQERAAFLLEQFGLSAAANKRVKEYSGGMRRRLDLAAVLVASPKIILLDEPTTGLDPRSRIDLWEIIDELANSGSTVLLTTQYLEEADRLASDLVVIDSGKIIANGTPSEIKALVGSTILDVVLTDAKELYRASSCLAEIARSEIRVEVEDVRLRVSVDDRRGVLVDAVRLLDSQGIDVAEISVVRPSLDDAFLTLTGHGVIDADDQ